MMATPEAGYSIEVVNEVLGTRKRIWSHLSRGEIVENMLWLFRRFTAEDGREPFETCVFLFLDRVVVHLHCPAWADLEAAKAAMQTLSGEGSAAL